mmetsp:Transcript_23710/g.21073  ORF Transcript_23710/g.21073 Transcript_23710/m.21073 type:complete len:99 (+) Transcript_23710:61-357(+)
MTDKSADVQGAILVYLDEIVQVLLPSTTTEEFEENEIAKKIGMYKVTFCQNFINMEETVKSNYRHLIRWIDCHYKLIDLFDSTMIIKKTIPILINHLK